MDKVPVHHMGHIDAPEDYVSSKIRESGHEEVEVCRLGASS